MEYTMEHIMRLREELKEIGIGYISIEGVIAFDKAVSAQVRKLMEGGHIKTLN